MNAAEKGRKDIVKWQLNSSLANNDDVGDNDDEVTETAPVGQLAPVDSLLDLIRNLIPANIVYASFAQVSTGRTATVTTYDCTVNTTATIDNAVNICPSSKVVM